MSAKLSKLTMLCLLFLAAITGCGKKEDAQNAEATPQVPQAPPQNPGTVLKNWPKFTCIEGKFSVLLPGVPKERHESAQTQYGQMSYRAWAAMTDAHDAYGAGYYDIQNPPDSKTLLDGLLSLIVGKNGKIQSSHNTPLGNYPGREFEFTPDPKASYDVRVRMIQVGSRVYTLTAIFLLADPHPQECEAFFNSFALQGN